MFSLGGRDVAPDQRTGWGNAVTGKLPPRLPKASDVVADRLRAEILGQGLQPGDDLPSEADIIQTHGFSRGTVREALRLLEAEGLISVKRGPKGGVRVRRPDVSQVSRSLALLFTTTQVTLREFLAYRKLMEPQAAALAADNATSAQRELLLAIVASDESLQDDLGRSPEFHGAVGDATNNGVYRTVMEALHHVLEWHAPGERLSREDVAATQRAHRRIAEAIMDGDGDVARRAMLRHLEGFEQVLEERGRLDEPIVSAARWIEVARQH